MKVLILFSTLNSIGFESFFSEEDDGEAEAEALDVDVFFLDVFSSEGFFVGFGIMSRGW